MTNPQGSQSRIPHVTEDEKKTRRRSDRIRLILAAFSGVPAGFAALAVAELVPTVVRPQVGSAVAFRDVAIDVTPAAVKGWAFQNRGIDEQLILQLGIPAVPTLFALTLGMLVLHFRRPGVRSGARSGGHEQD
ncbi:hypothetical protein [Streptomyces griseorubiginosus]|uniref:hypothetical protein n=1 Tax=Streptomyces griseorubiginosus TaxID=67304 RepID=UPI001140015F|nr:hypothetical protein [Streptomyces griseorubiginosus]